MTPSEIQEQLRSGTTIAEVCTQNNLTFKQLCDMFPGAYAKKTKSGKKVERKYPMYIIPVGRKYSIKKKVGKKYQSFGLYESIEDALKVRDYMIMNGWYKSRLKRVREELGV